MEQRAKSIASETRCPYLHLMKISPREKNIVRYLVLHSTALSPINDVYYYKSSQVVTFFEKKCKKQLNLSPNC